MRRGDLGKVNSLGKGEKKNSVIFHLDGGGSAWFSTKKKMVLKHWILPIDHFKAHYFFFQFLVGETLLSLDPGPKGVSNL